MTNKTYINITCDRRRDWQHTNDHVMHRSHSWDWQSLFRLCLFSKPLLISQRAIAIYKPSWVNDIMLIKAHVYVRP